MIINEYYSKETMESFAVNTIGLSFDEKYLQYKSPPNTDGFDFLSPDEANALEVTLVTTKNVMEAYEYECQRNKGKQNLHISRINGAVIKDDGSIKRYSGGSMEEIKNAILNAITTKQEKAKRRYNYESIKTVDLCICVADGGLFDLQSFEFFFDGLNNTIFEHIFFITPVYFICFRKKRGFSEHKRIIE